MTKFQSDMQQDYAFIVTFSSDDTFTHQKYYLYRIFVSAESSFNLIKGMKKKYWDTSRVFLPRAAKKKTPSVTVYQPWATCCHQSVGKLVARHSVTDICGSDQGVFVGAWSNLNLPEILIKWKDK